MTDVIQDLCTLTTIPRTALDKLVRKSEGCICHAIEEAKEEDTDVVSVNIGIGTLQFTFVDDTLEYRFIPSLRLEKEIIATVQTGESPLVLDIETALRDKILNVYKNLF